MDDALRNAEKRLQRYWNVDGLHELAIAVLLSLTAVWHWASNVSDFPRAWKGAFAATFPILLCGGIAVEGAIVKAIRRRLTYPRAGYVEFRKPPRSRIWRAVGLGAVTTALAGLAVRSDVDFRWAIAAIGIGMAALLWHTGSRSNVPRFLAVAGLIAAAGVAIAGSGWTFDTGIVVFFAIAATSLFVSGGVTLWRFLHA